LNNGYSDWIIAETQFDESVSRQSNWSPEPLRTISNSTSQNGSTISTNLIKSNAWDESEDVRKNMKRLILDFLILLISYSIVRSRIFAYCRPILLGLIFSLVLGGVALAAILTLWLTSSKII